MKIQWRFVQHNLRRKEKLAPLGTLFASLGADFCALFLSRRFCNSTIQFTDCVTFWKGRLKVPKFSVTRSFRQNKSLERELAPGPGRMAPPVGIEPTISP